MQLVCTQSWVPLRADASSASEMVSSLLFGETCKLKQENGDWWQVVCNHDGYEGWIPSNYLSRFEKEHECWNKKVTVHGAVMQNSGGRIDLSPGAFVPENLECTLAGNLFRFSDARVFEPEQKDAAGLSMLFLHTPYLWGGRSVWGIDCSGLVQVVMSMLGHSFPRDAYQQAREGREIPFAEIQSGDLAYFEKQGRITHVGIVLSNRKIIHASGKVRIDDFIAEGIQNSETGEITHNLACIKRV